MSPQPGRRFLGLSLVLGLLPDSGLAQCPMCRTALIQSTEGQQMAAAFNAGILFLVVAPILVVATVAFFIVRLGLTDGSPEPSVLCQASASNGPGSSPEAVVHGTRAEVQGVVPTEPTFPKG